MTSVCGFTSATNILKKGVTKAGHLFMLIALSTILITLPSPAAVAYEMDAYANAPFEYQVSYDRIGFILHQVIEGPIAYVAYKGVDGDCCIAAVDLDDQTEPEIIWSLRVPDSIEDITLEGSRLLAATTSQGMWIIDVAMPGTPVLVDADLPEETQTRVRLRDGYIPPYTSLPYYQYSYGGLFNYNTLFAGNLSWMYGAGSGLPWRYQTSLPSSSWYPSQSLTMQYGTGLPQAYTMAQYTPSFSYGNQYPFGWSSNVPGIGLPYYGWGTGGMSYVPQLPVGTPTASKPSTSPVVHYRSPVPIRVSLDNPSDGSVTGTITMRLKDLNGKSVSVQEETLTIDPGKNDYPLSLTMVPKDTSAEEFGKYTLGYDFSGDGGIGISGEKSLFYLADLMEARILGSDSLFAGKPAFIGVHAFVHGHPVPIEGATVSIDLIAGNTTYPMFTDTTDDAGFIEVPLTIPEDLIGSGTIRAKITSDLGTETITEDIEIVRRYKILLTTDKPVYQPGHTIHIRTLTLNKSDRTPASGRQIIIEVEDPKGNKVFRVENDIDDFGIAAADFTLGSYINLGVYTIRAICMDNDIATESEKKVRVERYVLPKFKVGLVTDADYYQPGDTVTGTVHAGYFFGQDLSNAVVTIEASKFDVEFVTFQTINGTTDAEGFFPFTLQLPTYFVGIPLDQGNAFVKLDVKVEDAADHAESITSELTVTRHPIIVRVVPESGAIVYGVENTLHLITTDPKGRGIATTNLVNFDGSVFNVNTDDQGMGSFTATPDEGSSLIVQVASQANGQSALVEIDLSDDADQPKILLRTDKAIYTVGDVMTMDIYTPEIVMARRAFVDIVREGQTILTRGVDIQDGHGEYVLDVSSDMEGTILVEAYYISLETETASDVFRDKKIVYVNSATELQVTATLDKDQYLPGEAAHIDFQVTPPQAAALGISIVDEAVFSLQENRPALLKVFFSMEEDIMVPRFWPLLFPFEEAITSEDPEPQIQEMAAIAFASAEEPDDPGLDESSYPGLVQRMKEALVNRIDQDAEQVAKDLGNLWVYSEWSYESALNQGKIKTYQDPWGNTYTLAVGTNQVSLTTRGPDGKSGTLDDITYTLQYEQVYKPNPAPVRQQVPIGGGLWGGLWGMPFVGGQFFAPAPMLDINRNAQGLAYGAYASAAYGGTGGTVDAGGTYVAQTKQGFMSSPEQGGETPSEGTEETVEPRRVRRDFPETLLWEPCLITDPNGTAFLDANMADSITTWRMSTMASGMDGSLGGNTDGIVVFQEFFIDLDLPVALTRNDEISLPVAIYNYLEDSQSVRIVIDTNNPWFDLLDASEKEVDLEPGEVTSVHFRIRAQEVGWHELTVFGYGTSMSDAIARTIEVLPDGLEFNTSISDRLAGSSIERTVTIPADAIDNASRILVKVYPGIFSQVVEGLDNLFRVPHGCFTQSTTITWPNVLVLDYMLTTDQITPEIEMKAREYVNLGYQRLLTFECPNGGFSWYGNEPAKPVLTAYGLMEFTDMARVQYVDPAMIQRTQEWLIGRQQNDGSWPPDQVRELFNVLSNNLQATAYAVWALIHSGYSAQHQKIIKGLDYVRSNWDGVQDNYTLALCAHALLEADAQDSTGFQILDILESAKIVEGDTVYWTSTQPSMTYSRGNSLSLETTAMITLALMKAGWRYPQSINGAINYIIQHRDAFGNWGQTQATVLCLRVLMTAMSGQTQEMEGDIVIAINGQTLDHNDLPVLRITPVDSSVVRLIDLKPYTMEGDNQVGISLIGEGNLLYQIVGSYFLPWQGVGIPTSPQLKIDLTYDRQNLTVDDIILCTVTATNTVPGSVTQMGMLDLGIPPGFRIFWEDFEEAIEVGKIFKYESTNRQLTLYLHPLPYNEPLSITYRLQAKYPLKVTTPRSRVYDYFNPDIGNETRPVILTVTD